MVRTLLPFFLSLLLCGAALAQSTIKVMSFNILHGATTKGDFNLDAIAKVIKDADPDFVALQEVDFKTKRAKNYDLATELGQRTGMAPLFGRAMPYNGGEYGEGMLSKYSFVSTRNVPLPYTPGNEPRAALEVTVQLPSGDTISVIGTHFDHLEDGADRVSQAKAVNAAFRDNQFPSVLMGDLNDVPGSIAINTLEEVWSTTYDKGNPVPTYPSDEPKYKIDYVMTSPGKWEVVNTEVICDTVASDHCAYLVTLSLK